MADQSTLEGLAHRPVVTHPFEHGDAEGTGQSDDPVDGGLQGGAGPISVDQRSSEEGVFVAPHAYIE